jgi:preprotein translocase subunit SecF
VVVVLNIVEKRYWYFRLSALIVVPGLISLILFGLPRSIDFAGGALFEVTFPVEAKVTEERLAAIYGQHGFDEPQIIRATTTGGEPADDFQIRSREISPEQKEAISQAMREELGEFTEVRFESVGPSVGAQVTRAGLVAVLLASVGILLYLTFAFRNVPHPVRYGVCAITAMLHDVLVVLGLASILGKLLGWEVDALFLTALLTVIGFSVHDTIVVFDRIRENVERLRGNSFERIVNHSIIQTLDRSINTQLTALFTLYAIFVFSHGQLQRFVFWLMVGIISGTYSSIFNAAPLLVVWENREWRTWFRRRGEAASPAS